MFALSDPALDSRPVPWVFPYRHFPGQYCRMFAYRHIFGANATPRSAFTALQRLFCNRALRRAYYILDFRQRHLYPHPKPSNAYKQPVSGTDAALRARCRGHWPLVNSLLTHINPINRNFSLLLTSDIVETARKIPNTYHNE